MGGRNSRGPSTKTGKIVDGRPKCEGVIHENGRNRGWGTVYFTDQEPSPSVQAPSATV